MIDRRLGLFAGVLILLTAGFLPRAIAAQLTWPEILKLAAQNNSDLISAREAMIQKKSAIDVAVSQRFPVLSAGLNVSQTKSNSLTSKNYSYGFSANQMLFNGFKTAALTASAKENLLASKAAYQFSDVTMRYNVRRAFIEMLYAQELIQTAREIVKIRRDSLVLITLRFSAGLEDKGALLTAQANLTQAQYELESSTFTKETARKNLCFNLGIDDDLTLEVSEEFVGREILGTQPDFEVLLKNNPALLQAAAQKFVAQYLVSSARADFYPQVNAQLSASKSGESFSSLDNQWMVGAGLSIPLFEGGLLTARLDQAKSFYRQTQAQEKSARFNALKTLSLAWQNLNDAVGLVKVREEILNAAVERSRISAGKYSAGFIGFDSKIIIENALVNEKKACLQAKISALLAKAAWEQAKGDTYEE